MSEGFKDGSVCRASSLAHRYRYAVLALQGRLHIEKVFDCDRIAGGERSTTGVNIPETFRGSNVFPCAKQPKVVKETL